MRFCQRVRTGEGLMLPSGCDRTESVLCALALVHARSTNKAPEVKERYNAQTSGIRVLEPANLTNPVISALVPPTVLVSTITSRIMHPNMSPGSVTQRSESQQDGV